jgi:dihydrofolate synthase/folylpolyglutamate synthase
LRKSASDLILARLQTLHPKSIDLSLGRIERLLAALGHPEELLPPVVHIAGTNGKGSTLAMLAAMLEAAGRRVHRYISPHLVHFNERILLHGEPIDEGLLEAVLDACERANVGAPITFFEITTAAAFLAFTRVPADVVLLETGLGGRLDATNVVARPRLTLLAPVSLDHESYLGSTLDRIAFEKAGILKPGVPVIAGPQAVPAAEVIQARAREVGAPLLLRGRDWEVCTAGTGLVVEAPGQRLTLPRPALAGEHQIENAGLAAMAALHLGELRPSDDAIAAGLRTVRWPARLQRLTRGPLVDLLPPGSELVLDGGHNPAAGEALARTLRATPDPRPLRLIVGMLTTKDLASFLRPLAPLARSVRIVGIPGEALAYAPDAGAALARAAGIEATPAPIVTAAIRELREQEPGPCRVLICGSLYLAGQVLRDNG